MLGRVIVEKAETRRARKTLSNRLSEDSLHSSPPNCAAIRILKIQFKSQKFQATIFRSLHSAAALGDSSITRQLKLIETSIHPLAEREKGEPRWRPWSA